MVRGPWKTLKPFQESPWVNTILMLILRCNFIFSLFAHFTDGTKATAGKTVAERHTMPEVGVFVTARNSQ